jgi:multiple sugar transport system permease protein
MRSASFRIRTFVLLVLTVAVFTVILFPPFVTLLTSLKTEVDAFTFPPKWIFKPILSNYSEIFQTSEFLRYVFNSLLVAGANTCLCLLLGSPAAYGLARFRFRGADNLAFWILSLRMMPPVAAIIPVYILMKNLHFLDTPWALITVYLTFNLPFVVWMMKGFFEDIPREIEESALVDGCSELGIFSRIAVPLAAPGLAATAIIIFIFAWNEFLFALILTATKSVTLPVGILGYMKETGINWGYMTAGGILSLIPVIIFTSLSQRYLVKGLTLGALK